MYGWLSAFDWQQNCSKMFVGLMQLIDIGQEIHEQCGNPGVATSRNWIANLLIVYTTTPNFNFYCTLNLRRNLKTHSGEKSSSCSHCDYASSQTGHIWGHLCNEPGVASRNWIANLLIVKATTTQQNLSSGSILQQGVKNWILLELLSFSSVDFKLFLYLLKAELRSCCSLTLSD